MRTPREIRADLDAANDEIEAYWTLSGPHRYQRRAELDALNVRRRRLEAELAESRAADEATPSLFADPSRGDIQPNPDRPLSRSDEAALSALADYYDEKARP